MNIVARKSDGLTTSGSRKRSQRLVAVFIRCLASLSANLGHSKHGDEINCMAKDAIAPF
jgi:hypothetical protein